MIKVSHQIRKHKGGTKFYETTLFLNEEGRSVLVKRFGAMAKLRGGGQYKIEDYDNAIEATKAANSIWREKDKPKEYSEACYLDHGFGLFVTGKSEYVDFKQLHDDTAGHYSAGPERTSDTADTIFQLLGISPKYDPNTAINDKPAEPAWTPHESDDFGSW